MTRPLLGITADFRRYDNAPYHVVGDKYARAVWEAVGFTPIIIPAKRCMTCRTDWTACCSPGASPTSIRRSMTRNPLSATSPTTGHVTP